MNRVELQVGCQRKCTPVATVENVNLRRATVEATNKLAFPEGRHGHRLRTDAEVWNREKAGWVIHVISYDYCFQGYFCLSCQLKHSARRVITTRTSVLEERG